MFDRGLSPGDDKLPPLRWSIVVVTSLECILDAKSGWVASTVQQTTHTLTDHDIPLVLISTRGPRELRRVQRELGIVAPFLSDGGHTLHIPFGYFPGQQTSPEEGEWEIFEFKERGAAPQQALRAVRTLLAKYRQHRPDMVAIGLGSAWSDRLLLQSVDVPVIVRHTGIDQKALERACPEAFVTLAEGPAGWSEAILGQT
jgi:predicted mannosyl-3-phosphoglycerate phosphatase (HAD superfamily)